MPTFVLISWPFFALAFFAIMGPARALIWTTLIGYLFLPERFGFDVAGLPSYNKYTAMALTATLGYLLFRPQSQSPIIAPKFRTLMLLLVAVLLVSPIGTYITNTSPAVSGGRVLPGLSPNDALNMMIEYVVLLVPFFLAWRLFDRPEHYREILIALVAMGCVYTLPVLFEIRMSPQLNNWIYGFFPHDWRQHMRGGGFRPIVFLEHGLWVGFFLLTAVLAAAGLFRNGERLTIFIGILLFLVLAISRNTGALLLAIVLVPMLLVVTRRLQMRFAMVIALAFLFYPQVKLMTQEPIAQFQSYVSSLSAERGASLQTRLKHEAELLERGNLKPVFGWGAWGRPQLYSERGYNISITDGGWVIQFGKYGWVGYLAYFGLLILPILALSRRMRDGVQIPVPVLTLTIISTANLIYLIPNATLTPVGMLCFGALAAFAQYGNATDKQQAREPEEAEPRRQARYTRFAPGQAPPIGSRPLKARE